MLAAFLGTIVGVSLSPEVPVVGIIAGLTVKRTALLPVVAIVTSIAITALTYALVSRSGMAAPNGQPLTLLVAARFTAVLVLAFIARGIKRLVTARRPAG